MKIVKKKSTKKTGGEKAKDRLKSVWSKLEGRECGIATDLLIDGPVQNTNKIRFHTRTIELLTDTPVCSSGAVG